MDKMKRFIDCSVNTFACNLKCHYCYVAQNYLFTQKVPKFKYSADVVGKALTKERLGGTCMFNICATGETLIPGGVIEYTKAILAQGHYVMVVTNGMLTKRLEEIAQFPEDYRKRLFFKISYHYLELKRLNKFEHFFSNIELIKKMKASFTVEVTPTDELIPYIDEMKEITLKHLGALPHITVARDESKPDYPLLTKLSREDYIKTWGQFDSMMFNFKIKVFGEKRREYCFAGNWTYTLNLLTGTMKQCYKTNYFANIYKHLDKPLKFVNIGHGCKAPHCHNAHAFLCFGAIPELDTPFYYELRNRVCADGSEWLQPEMKAFMSCKLKDENEETHPAKDLVYNWVYNIIYRTAWSIRTILKKVDKNYKANEVHK